MAFRLAFCRIAFPSRTICTAPREMLPPQMSKPTMLFVGAVNPVMNLDALQVLAAASELLPAEYELLYCTAADLATLQR